MHAYVDGRGDLVVELTRRNLSILLEKLDDEASRKRIGKEFAGSKVWIQAVEDDAHYEDRAPGAMLVDGHLDIGDGQGDVTVAQVAEPTFGFQVGAHPVNIHGPDRCAGTFCPFHNPSDHTLKNAPINIRMDKMALVERMCEHGIGHDDPDSVAYLESKGFSGYGVHGCDGCCREVV